MALALAADEGYALPLAVTVRSILDNSPQRQFDLFVLDGGISQVSRDMAERSWDRDRLRVTWLRPDLGALQGLPVSGHINLVAYCRFLLPGLLPPWLDKVIYLDSDLLFRADAGRLWEEPLAGAWCLAVPDVSMPVFDAVKALDRPARCAPYLAALRPVSNYARLAIQPDAAYLNSGLLVIDLARWRADGVPRLLFECLARNRFFVRFHDQYALNVVLAGRWRALDMRWNQGAHIYRYPSWEDSPFSEDAYRLVREDPFVVHFSSRDKPWHYGYRHPSSQEFFRYLDCTAWAGWRPQSPGFDLAQQLRRGAEGLLLFGGRLLRRLQASGPMRRLDRRRSPIE